MEFQKCPNCGGAGWFRTPRRSISKCSLCRGCGIRRRCGRRMGAPLCAECPTRAKPEGSLAIFRDIVL